MFGRIFVAAVVVAVASANFLPLDFNLDSIKRPSSTNYGGSGASAAEPTPATNNNGLNTDGSTQSQDEPLVKLTFSVSKLRQLLAGANVGPSGTITINVPDSAVAMAPSPTATPTQESHVSVSRRSEQPRGAVRELPSGAPTAGRDPRLDTLLRLLGYYE